MTQDTQTKWVVSTFAVLVILALATLAGLDRARIAGDATAAFVLAAKVDRDQVQLKAETARDVEYIKAQLAEIQERQRELLIEMRRRR